MSAVIPDPLQEFLAQDPTALVDPTILVEPELEQEEAVRSGHGKVTAAVGLGAAYLVYRSYMARKMKETVRAKGGDVDHRFLMAAASLIWNSFIPRWVSMTAPYLVAGYIEGVKAADAGNVPEPVLRAIATSYAEELGNHINQVSADAVVSGFNAQVNRKVPPFLAAKRVSDAYGVPKRGMNALVNVWMSEEKARVSDRPLPSSKDERAKALIASQNTLRARQVGDNESWAARTQAKQIVWMYGVDKGVLPSSARRVWITADDERVCEICGPLDGRSAPVGEQFKTELGKFWTPPTHINCRCDVALDLSVTGDIQDEITALLESETVTKAVGTDPYDRDKRGRFARDEGRSAKPFKEREAEVDEMLAQINRVLSATPTVTKTPDLAARPISGSSLRSPNLASPNLGSPNLGAKMGANLGTSFSGIRGKGISISLDHPGLFSTPINSKPIRTAEGRWQPLDYPLVTIMSDWGDNPVDYSEDIIVLLDRDTKFYEVRPRDSMPDRYERSLQKALGDYWNKVENQLMEEWSGRSGEERSYFSPDKGRHYAITDDDYWKAVVEAINNIPAEQSTKVRLYGYGETADDHVDVTLFDLAEYTSVFEEVATHTPHLIVTKHGFPGETGPITGQPPDVQSNPGKWQLIKDESANPFLSQYPYQIHYAEPTDLLDDGYSGG